MKKQLSSIDDVYEMSNNQSEKLFTTKKAKSPDGKKDASAEKHAYVSYNSQRSEEVLLRDSQRPLHSKQSDFV